MEAAKKGAVAILIRSVGTSSDRFAHTGVMRYEAEVPRIPPPPPGDTGRALSDADAPGMDRLELARAYLDLGDQESARQLLGELVVTGGLEARQQATRLLREMG